MSNLSTDEANFLRWLSGLASVCKFDLTPDLIAMYDKCLSPLGYEKAAKALQRIFLKRTSKDPFPSTSEIISETEEDKECAYEIADRIWDAVSTCGYNNEARARQICGPIGARVIELCGWRSLCELDAKQGPMIKAQLRQTAQRLIDKKESMRTEVLLESQNMKQLPDVGKLLKEL